MTVPHATNATSRRTASAWIAEVKTSAGSAPPKIASAEHAATIFTGTDTGAEPMMSGWINTTGWVIPHSHHHSAFSSSLSGTHNPVPGYYVDTLPDVPFGAQLTLMDLVNGEWQHSVA